MKEVSSVLNVRAWPLIWNQVESASSTITIEDARPTSVRYIVDTFGTDLFFAFQTFSKTKYNLHCVPKRTFLDYLYTGQLPQSVDEEGKD